MTISIKRTCKTDFFSRELLIAHLKTYRREYKNCGYFFVECIKTIIYRIK